MSNLKLYNYQQRIVEFCKKEPKEAIGRGGDGKEVEIFRFEK